MAFSIAALFEDDYSWSIDSPENNTDNLLQLDEFDSAGDLPYLEQNGRAYIYDESADSLVLLKEKWGESEFDMGVFRAWEDWGYGSRKLRAVEEKAAGGWVIAIEESWDGQSNWQVLDVDSAGHIVWENSYWGDIKSKEYLFEVSGSLNSGDLNGDGVIGVNASSLTASSLDTNGANVLVDSDGYAYIKVSDASDANVIAITDFYGHAVRFNQSWSSPGGGGSSSEEATHAQLDTTGSDDVYKVIVKQTEDYTFEEIRYHVHTINLDGTFDWQTQWDIDLVDYEVAFGEDFDGDDVYGFNSANLEPVSTDVDADSSASDAVSLMKDKSSGSLYIYDASGSGNTIKINDHYLEESGSWGDGTSYYGSFSSTVYAAAKNDFSLDSIGSGDSGSYSSVVIALIVIALIVIALIVIALIVTSATIVAIKRSDSYTSEGLTQVSTYWDILPIEPMGPRWEYASFTDSIAGMKSYLVKTLIMIQKESADVGNLTPVKRMIPMMVFSYF